MNIFVVSQPDYEGENIDSVWTTEKSALARATELDGAFLSEYRINRGDAWVRNGWAPSKDRPMWSDWDIRV